MSGDFVNHMLQMLELHPEILKYFFHSYAPDELLIPTIIFNSNYVSHAIESDFPDSTHYNCKTVMHYLNYSPTIEIFDESKYEDIIKSGKAFVRKVMSGKSDGFLRLIDIKRTD